MKNLLEYTELAMNLVGGDLPSIVYLPPAIRGRRTRITTKGIATEHPLTAEEQLDRIVQSDPIGFLIAMMHGQPVVTFRIGPKTAGRPKRNATGEALLSTDPNTGLEVHAEYHSPTIPDRERIAQFLIGHIPSLAKEKKKGGKQKGPQPDEPVDEFEKLVNDRVPETE